MKSRSVSKQFSPVAVTSARREPLFAAAFQHAQVERAVDMSRGPRTTSSRLRAAAGMYQARRR